MTNKMKSPFDSLKPETKKLSQTDRENEIHKTVNYYGILEIYGRAIADHWLSLCKKLTGGGMTCYHPTKESVEYNNSLN